MLYYNDQINIAMGLIISYRDNKPPMYKIKGNKDKYQNVYNWERFSGFTKSKFILFCTYIISEYNTLNMYDFIKYYNDINGFEQWLEKLKVASIIVKKEINELNKKYGDFNKTYMAIVGEYLKGNVHFLTLYSILKAIDKLEELKNSRAYNIVWKKLTFLKNVLKFKEFSIKNNV